MARSRGTALAIPLLAVVLLTRLAIPLGGDRTVAETPGSLADGQRPVVTAAVTPRTDPLPAPPLEIRGSGWGHGVGLSQYGAQAQALDGRSAAHIVGHYYPGTNLSAADPATASQPVRVGLFANRLDAGEVHVAARGRLPGPPTSPVRIRLSPGQGTHELSAGEAWRVRLAGGHYELATPAGVVVDRGPGPVQAQPAAPAGANPGLLSLPQLGVPGDHLAGTFQWGELEITSHGGRMQPVLVVGLEDYLRGVAEMASAWAGS